MKVLHTSDWHIGRSFHAHSTTAALATVFDALVAKVEEQNIEVVIVAGDVFDSATPSAGSFTLLERTLIRLREAGAAVILTSGNHDSAARLGFQSTFARLAGIHVLTDAEKFDEPVTIGDVDFFGIPYLEPAIVRGRYPDAGLRTQADTMKWAMDRVRTATSDRPSVVIAHCFAAGVQPTSSLEREIRAGTLDVVPLTTFDGADYVALGHIHGRQELSPTIRYSGAPLHYSFKEASKPRGAWLLDITDRVGEIEWVELPVPRPLAVLTGTLAELLADATFSDHEGSWVSAVLTDESRPVDAMLRLQKRFPYCANVEYKPAVLHDGGSIAYSERIKSKSDAEIIAAFLTHVRNGEGPTSEEEELIEDVLQEHSAEEAVA
ncbi:exonuclease SbcCD subunit D [Leifsonia xyli]|uniref:exonuclease SbcCD subunit D n=1 Tax=Leifsonia xyli TaxID=1575 RepID=UPI003D668D3E